MGIIKEQYKEYGSEFLSNFLIGMISSVIECDFTSDSEKVEEIKK